MSTWQQGPEAIIAPTSLQSFMDTHWDDAPLVIQDRNAEVYGELLSIDDLDQLIHSSGLRYPTFRLVREGREIPAAEYTVGPLEWGTGKVTGFIDLDRTRAWMNEGCTLVMEACQRLHQPIARLSRLFEQTFQCPSPVGTDGSGRISRIQNKKIRASSVLPVATAPRIAPPRAKNRECVALGM